jgi:hypothetical protein
MRHIKPAVCYIPDCTLRFSRSLLPYFAKYEQVWVFVEELFED